MCNSCHQRWESNPDDSQGQVTVEQRPSNDDVESKFVQDDDDERVQPLEINTESHENGFYFGSEISLKIAQRISGENESRKFDIT